MNCARIARDCNGQPIATVRLDGVRDPKQVCGPCLGAASRLGMNPVRVPEWMARGRLARDETRLAS